MATTTAAAVFLNSLADAGVTHVFVNWGNDHPAILEELERQRVEHGRTKLEIVTCPNEMVALSAAQGFTQVSGVPSAVIVHVDVGTQVRVSFPESASRRADFYGFGRLWLVPSTTRTEDACRC